MLDRRSYFKERRSVLGILKNWILELYRKSKVCKDFPNEGDYLEKDKNKNLEKDFDFENEEDILKKYKTKECIVDIMEVLAELDDTSIQLILKEITNTTLLYALAGASGEVCIKFMRNLSERMLLFLDEQLQTENFEVEQIEEAQNVILQAAYAIEK